MNLGSDGYTLTGYAGLVRVGSWNCKACSSLLPGSEEGVNWKKGLFEGSLPWILRVSRKSRDARLCRLWTKMENPIIR